MSKALVRINFRQTIDVTSSGLFEKEVLAHSYSEFLLKSQAYNLDRKFKKFSEMKQNDGRANSLHYKTGFAVAGYIQSLNNRIPVLQDTLGKNIRFINHKFEIIESDITDKTFHSIAITYYTDTFIFHTSIGDYMLLSPESEMQKEKPGDMILLKIRDGLSIISYKEIKETDYDFEKATATGL